MKNILQEIHGRSLWQVLGLYLASSWVVLQVVDTLDGVIGLPAWVGSAAIMLLLAGLPIVMATAFVQRGWGSGTGEPDDAEAPATAIAPDEAEASRRVFTWRNALLGGVGAFALLGLGTAAWIGMRAAGIGPAGTLVAKGVLEERGLVLLADFENATPDPTLSAVVTEAMRVDLSQSEALELADPGFIAEALGRMQRDPETPITEEVAFEIARREGVRAVVTGDVARAGGGFVLSTSLVAPEDGEILLSHRESARDSTQLLDAIDGLSRYMRERIGDPLKSISTTPPLAQVTTHSLEALRAFSQATRLPESEATRRRSLLEDAVAADSTFAMAWNALSTQLANYGVEPGRALEARAKSFEYRENLPAREHEFVSAMYYLSGTNQPRQAIPYLEAIIEQDPTAAGPINNLGEAYRELGDLDRAVELYERAIAADSSTSAIPFMNLAQVHTTLGDREAALAAADYLEIYGGPPWPDWHRAATAAGLGDYRAGEALMRNAVEQMEGRSFLLAQTTQWLGTLLAVQGKIDESAANWRAAAEIQEEGGSDVEALRNRMVAAVVRGIAYRSADVAGLDAVIETSPLAEMDPVVRPTLDLAEGYALLGHADRARELLEDFEATTPELHQQYERYFRNHVRGEIALLENRPDDAIEAFRLSASRPQDLDPIVGLARAFDAAGMADSARVYYRRFLEQPHWIGAFTHARFLANALERAAELEFEAGNLREAAAHLARFVELWENADEGLQPRVRAAQSRLQEILNEVG